MTWLQYSVVYRLKFESESPIYRQPCAPVDHRVMIPPSTLSVPPVSWMWRWDCYGRATGIVGSLMPRSKFGMTDRYISYPLPPPTLPSTGSVSDVGSALGFALVNLSAFQRPLRTLPFPVDFPLRLSPLIPMSNDPLRSI
jgi:hypothetical protein